MDSYVRKCCNISTWKVEPAVIQTAGSFFLSPRGEKTFPPAIENRPIWMSNFRMNIFINMYHGLVLSRLLPSCKLHKGNNIFSSSAFLLSFLVFSRRFSLFFVILRINRTVRDCDKLLKLDYWITQTVHVIPRSSRCCGESICARALDRPAVSWKCTMV